MVTSFPKRIRISSSFILQIAVLGMVCLAFCKTSDAAKIRLRSQATVSASIVTLGDLAEISDAKAPLMERLLAIEISPVPPVGRTVIIDFDTIRTRVSSRGVDISSIDFTGSSRVQVTANESAFRGNIRQTSGTGGATNWKSTEASRVVSRAVATHLRIVASNAGTFSVVPQLDANAVHQLSLAEHRTVVASGGKTPWQGKQIFKISFQTRTKENASLSVVVHLKSLPFVLAARSALPRGHILRQHDLIWKQVISNTKGGDAKGYVSPKFVIGQETLKPIAADQVIHPDHLQKSQMVRPNDIVSVYVRTSAFTLQRQFKARSGGALGDTIKLVDLKGKNPIAATITGFREAEIVTAKRVQRTDIAPPRTISQQPKPPAKNNQYSLQ